MVIPRLRIPFGTRKALEKQKAARIFRCGHKILTRKRRQAAVSWPTTKASRLKASSWHFP
jgi:hypothetical protein